RQPEAGAEYRRALPARGAAEEPAALGRDPPAGPARRKGAVRGLPVQAGAGQEHADWRGGGEVRQAEALVGWVESSRPTMPLTVCLEDSTYPMRTSLESRDSPMSLPHVVVVEDEPAIRRGVTDALRVSGYEVSEAADGEAGLTAALRRDVGLVLLDLLLPRLDGLEVLAELRRARPGLPVIVLTARGPQ